MTDHRRIATEEAFAIPEQLEGYRALGRSTSSSADVVFWHRILSDPDSPLTARLLDLDLRRNFLITTSGMNHEPPLQLCRTVLGTERIMWAIDYPYQRSPDAVGFLDSVDLPVAELEEIYSGNAERAFHLRTRAPEVVLA
jgi:hypothetical protein